MIIRDYKLGDLSTLHAINIASEPGVGTVAIDRLAALIGAGTCQVATDGPNRPVGFLLIHMPDADYDSPNYQWFAERYDSFVYVDRIAVAPHVRGQSVGTKLYGHLIDSFAGRACLIGCEVNSMPPNPGSLRFHQRLGFKAVGSHTYSPDYAVTYLARRFAA